MTTAFDRAVEFILRPDIEGTFSNDPADKGKLTKWGVSSVSFPEVADPSFSRGRAVEIYAEHFWKPCQCDSFPPGFALMLFDARVNQTGQSIKLLQQSIGTQPDGVIGSNTIAQAKAVGRAGLIEFAALRMRAYGMHPDFAHNAGGWSRRLMACFELALSL